MSPRTRSGRIGAEPRTSGGPLGGPFVRPAHFDAKIPNGAWMGPPRPSIALSPPRDYLPAGTPDRRPQGHKTFMARDVVDGEIIESRDALAAWLETGCKRDGPLRLGTEHEKILFYRAGHTPVPYEGERGVAALIEGMNGRLGWTRIEDGGRLIGLYDEAGGGAISLEPGGQFELSGAA